MRHEAGPGLFPTDRAIVSVGTNQFAFEVPPGYRMDASDSGRVSLVSRDYSCLISFRIAGSVAPEATALDSAPYREFLASQFPGANILEQFSMSANNRSGPAFEFEWGGAGVFQRSRIAYIPSRGGVLEFSVSASPDKFAVALDMRY